MAGERTFRGDNLPELKADVLRLYSMRFCPFAQRTRLALLHKDVPFETINIDLCDKKPWFLEKNPIGVVPVIERNDEIVLESLTCSDWVEDNFPGGNLTAKNTKELYRWKKIVSIYESKVVSPYYASIPAAVDEVKYSQVKEKIQEGLNWLESVFGDKTYFAGEHCGYIDFAIYPWMERIPHLFGLKFGPKLTAWIENMQKLVPVQKTMFTGEQHIKWFQQYAAYKRGEATQIDFDFDLN